MLFSAVLAFSAMASCVDPTAPLPRANTKFSVLVIGDANVFSPQLRDMLNVMGRGLRDTLDVQLSTRSGWGLADLYLDGRASEAIANGGWRFVILQDEPIHSGDIRLLVKTWASRFIADMSSTGARAALVSPYAGVTDFFRASSSSAAYDQLSTDLGAVRIRIGNAWVQAWTRDQTLPFFSANDSSASRMANYLTAMVIYSSLTGARPGDLPAVLRLAPNDSISFTPAVTAILKAAATDAVNGR